MFKSGFVDNTGLLGIAHNQFLDLVRRVATGYGNTTVPGFTGTGNGVMSLVEAFPACVAETWTVTCITAVANGGTFSVVGSVTGALANATVGTPYTNAKVGFLISDGSTDFTVGAQFTFVVTRSQLVIDNQQWTTLFYDTSTVAHALILQGKGLSGTEEIFVGMRSYQSIPADYYNLSVVGFTGYVPGNAYNAQPGYLEMGLPAHNQRIDYWLAINGQRITFGIKVGTPVYETAYVGKFFPYATPTQYPYPLAVIGMLNGQSATRYSDTTHSMGFKGNVVNCKIRWLDGTWKQPQTFPWNNGRIGGSTSQLRDTNNSYPVMPIIFCESAPNVFGELDGIGYVSNFNNTVESTVGISGTDWVCLQDVARTSFNDYVAIRMT
jgi:hypothetical protein